MLNLRACTTSFNTSSFGGSSNGLNVKNTGDGFFVLLSLYDSPYIMSLDSIYDMTDFKDIPLYDVVS
jgi:hypothetical protein